jgi:spoIIIJ-associated protein
LTEPIDDVVIETALSDTALSDTALSDTPSEAPTEPLTPDGGGAADAGESAGAGDSADADAAEDADDAAETMEAEGGPARVPNARLVNEGDIAADYLEGLLDIADLDGDIDMDVEGDRAAVSIVGGNLGHLVGPNGEVLDALQELTRLAVLRETGERSRLMLDIEGHRARRRVELTQIGSEAADKSKASGEPVSLPAMTPFERKIVHDAVAAAGLVSESEGVEPMRYVVVRPA